MRFEYDSAAVAGSQMALPLFQPLRLWSPRQERGTAGRSGRGAMHCESDTDATHCESGRDATHCVCTVEEKSSSAIFCMKGGFVSVAGGERRLLIAGKIFRAVRN